MSRLSALFGRSAPLGITLRRFPLPVALAAAFALLAVLHNHGVALFDGALETDVFATLIIGFFWALSASLAASARAWPRSLEMALALTAIALTFLVLHATPNEVVAPIILLGEAALLTTLAAASPGLRPSHNETLWRFTAVALEGAAIALIAAVILAAGLCVLIFSMTYLFELRDPGRLIPDIWIVAMSVVWPLRALSTLPPAGVTAEKPALQFNTALSFLIDWALVPIWFAYLAVLYAYAAKILIVGELPRGNVAWMVHGFGAFGVALWLMAWPRRDTATPLTRFFHRWFWGTLPVPLLLLAVGVAERVGAYGWTEPRYMVAAGGAWLAAMALLYGLRPHRVALVAAPLSLAVLCVLATFGPWSAISVSVRDQHARLTTMLTRHGILVDGRVIPAKNAAAVPNADVEAINSTVRFLVAHDRLDLLRVWYPQGTRIAGDAHAETDAAQIVAAMGLPPLDRAGRAVRERRFIRTAYSDGGWPPGDMRQLVDLTGYGLVAELSFRTSEQERRVASPDGARTYRVRYDGAAPRLQITTDDNREIAIDLSPAFARLYAMSDNNRLSLLDSQPAILSAGTEPRARIVIRTVTIEKIASGLVGQDLAILLAISSPPP